MDDHAQATISASASRVPEEPATAGEAAYRYNAFISYSHAADGKLAPALQQGLHRFAKPLLQLRALRVFRDTTSLAANPGLWTSIEEALSQSEYFILLASPEAAASEWVTKEVDTWRRTKPVENMLIVLTDGDITWDAKANDFAWNKTTALPSCLSGVSAEEPRWIDLRWARTADDVSLSHAQFRECVADLAAPLHHRPKDELLGEDVNLLRRTKILTRSAIGLLTWRSVPRPQ